MKIDADFADKVIHGETAEEREKALQSLYRDIGRQLPSTVLDKWNAWRYLGAYFVSQGILRGIGEDDDKEKSFHELAGHQSYALEIGNISVTLDWLASEALPFFVGATLWKSS